MLVLHFVPQHLYLFRLHIKLAEDRISGAVMKFINELHLLLRRPDQVKATFKPGLLLQ